MSLLRSLPHVVLLLFSLCVAAGTASSQERALEIAALTRGADVVVVGKVAAVRSGWSADRSRIQTTVTVAVDQSLKGTPGGGSITLVTPGGEVDGVGEFYSHTARFKADEDVVVFARKDAAGTLRVSGGEQGKVGIRTDERTGARMVSGGVTLDSFVARIKSVTVDVTR